MQPPPDTREVNKELIPSQIKYIRQETDEINQYIKVHQYTMQTTPTGIRYMIYEHGKGELAKPGEYVQIAYSISLLDDSVCYDSKHDGPREFLVGKDDVESGVHQAVQLMHLGDKALFIIPSYLAQGIAGDRDKIPPSAVVIYDISLLKIQDKP
jgi:peptidyl-prolyl cis-trans isomerase A (cyclophilin A)